MRILAQNYYKSYHVLNSDLSTCFRLRDGLEHWEGTGLTSQKVELNVSPLYQQDKRSLEFRHPQRTVLCMPLIALSPHYYPLS